MKDIARVLRVPGSFNWRSNSVVEILKYSEKTYTLRLFQELMNDVNAVGWSIEIKKLNEMLLIKGGWPRPSWRSKFRSIS